MSKIEKITPYLAVQPSNVCSIYVFRAHNDLDNSDYYVVRIEFMNGKSFDLRPKGDSMDDAEALLSEVCNLLKMKMTNM